MSHIWGSSIKCVRKIFRKTNISNPLIRTHTCAYQGVRNVTFSENFAYVLYGCPLACIMKNKISHLTCSKSYWTDSSLRRLVAGICWLFGVYMVIGIYNTQCWKGTCKLVFCYNRFSFIQNCSILVERNKC